MKKKKWLIPFMILVASNAFAQKDISISLISPTNGQNIYNNEGFLIQYKLTNLGAPLTNQDTIYTTYMINGYFPVAPGGKILFVPYTPSATIPTNGSVDIEINAVEYINFPKSLNATFCLLANLSLDTGTTQDNNDACIKVNVDFPTALSEIAKAGLSLKVYPNPVEEVLNFSIDYNQAIKVTLLDITGKQVEVSPFWLKQTSINMSNYNAGIYIYEISSENGEIIKIGKIAVN